MVTLFSGLDHLLLRGKFITGVQSSRRKVVSFSVRRLLFPHGEGGICTLYSAAVLPTCFCRLDWIVRCRGWNQYEFLWHWRCLWLAGRIHFTAFKECFSHHLIFSGSESTKVNMNNCPLLIWYWYFTILRKNLGTLGFYPTPQAP